MLFSRKTFSCLKIFKKNLLLVIRKLDPSDKFVVKSQISIDIKEGVSVYEQASSEELKNQFHPN